VALTVAAKLDRDQIMRDPVEAPVIFDSAPRSNPESWSQVEVEVVAPGSPQLLAQEVASLLPPEKMAREKVVEAVHKLQVE
jgi:hypothetical protein